MGVMTIEGVVANGQIKLEGGVRLPENTRVYVVVPNVQVSLLDKVRLIEKTAQQIRHNLEGIQPDSGYASTRV